MVGYLRHTRFDIPVPTFKELFKEHALAPFFLFQIFCVTLWCLDEYWYYSVFTLFMLVFLESTIVKQRLRNLKEIRGMATPPHAINCFRFGKWHKITSNDLVPGDLVSLTRQRTEKNEDTPVPCDLLLLKGSCVANEAMLTGESIPQRKESIWDRPTDVVLDMKKADRKHVVFGGTTIVQANFGEKEKDATPKTPDNGCLAFVLRTGFHTSQGKLLQTILFSTERASANNAESLFFILFLLFFAIIAAGYVLVEGLKDEARSRWKLFLNVVFVLTSVVPPELPMELSLAVNTSLLRLADFAIFCTEPFRIPFAGKVSVCCFDKTGTLTSDDMNMEGVAGLEEASETGVSPLTEGRSVPLDTALVLAACHSLVFVDNSLTGDPIEKAALNGVHFSFSKMDMASGKVGDQRAVAKVLRRFLFSSALKRMSTMVSLEHAGFRVLAKGAPEEMISRFKSVPAYYRTTYLHYVHQGSRVLALGYKLLPHIQTTMELNTVTREDAETDLEFAGFLVLRCPLKRDSLEGIHKLRESSHRVVMITGDHALTACHVARELRIVTKPILILANATPIEWRSPDESMHLRLDENVSKLAQQYDLCISGDAMALLEDQEHHLREKDRVLAKIIPRALVFARVAPDQKEFILDVLKHAGFTTLMCGDGTNDVGALKQAHVGVALLGNEPPKKKEAGPKEEIGEGEEAGGMSGVDKKRNEFLRRMEKKRAMPTAKSKPTDAHPRRHLTLKQFLEEASKEEGEGVHVRLGDASIASPFTSKYSTILSTAHIIRQGRCTLVTTLQMFRILALNCLTSAYSLSVLYLDGVKYGDRQMTISGLLMAAFFLFISRSKPLDTLAPQRPHSAVFCGYMMLSILGQFLIHISTLVLSVRMAKLYMPGFVVDLDGDFEPNVVNSVVFLISATQMVATFLANYRGRPFMQGFSENKPLFYSLVFACFFYVLMSLDILPFLNESFELVRFPDSQFRNRFVLLVLCDMIGVFLWDKLSLFIFREPRLHD